MKTAFAIALLLTAALEARAQESDESKKTQDEIKKYRDRCKKLEGLAAEPP